MMTAIHLSATFAPPLCEPALMTEVIAGSARAPKTRAGTVCVDIGHVHRADNLMVILAIPATRDLERVIAATTAA